MHLITTRPSPGTVVLELFSASDAPLATISCVRPRTIRLTVRHALCPPIASEVDRAMAWIAAGGEWGLVIGSLSYCILEHATELGS